MNVRMMDTALDAMRAVNLVTLVVDASVPSGGGDRYLLELIQPLAVPVMLALNKVDCVEKPMLLPLIDHYQKQYDFCEIVPISAIDGTNVDRLENLFLDYLPQAPPLYSVDFVTDQREREQISEIVREQVLCLTEDELPFVTAVVVDRIENPEGSAPMALYCTILVERESQKRIVVGRAGSMVKAIGKAARIELEQMLKSAIYLDLRVKVKSKWRDNESLLKDMLSDA
jgi:GTP-binding protein Era